MIQEDTCDKFDEVGLKSMDYIIESTTRMKRLIKTYLNTVKLEQIGNW
jgi:hypothetical protein